MIRTIALVVALLVAGVVGWTIARSRGGYEYRAEIETVLAPLTSGRPPEVEALYEATSARFKQTLILDAFLDLADRIHQTLGRFVRVVEVVAVDQAATVAGRATHVEAELEFEHGRALGELSFLRDDAVTPPRELLLGLAIDIPDDRAPVAARLERESARLRAPAEVIDAVERILANLKAGRTAAMYGETAPAFRTAISERAFAELTRTHAAELGDFVQLVKVVSSAQNEGKNLARVQTLLAFEKRRTTATFEFQRVDGRWQLLAYKFNLPEPFSPRSRATGDAPAAPPASAPPPLEPAAPLAPPPAPAAAGSDAGAAPARPR